MWQENPLKSFYGRYTDTRGKIEKTESLVSY